MEQKRNHLASVGIFLSLLTLVPLFAPLLGLDSRYSVGALRDFVGQAGGYSWLAFIALFVAFVVVQIPGFAFVIAAPSLFELPEAWLLCVVASYLSVVVNFAVVRKFGGQPLAAVEKPMLKRLFAQLDAHPVRTVVLLRLLTVMFPPVTSALALTRLSARDHAIGSLLGIPLPITGMLLAAGALVHVSAG
ncbi:MAG TPA: VTT domain-containing protein [Polyangiales bacterium]|nr:VTT domain-containing protein [Polyangiales bacterium]